MNYQHHRDSIRVASICLHSRKSREENISRSFTLVTEAAENDAQWVVLPEMFARFGPHQETYCDGHGDHGTLLDKCRQLAKDLRITLFAGTMGESPNLESNFKTASKVYNTIYVIGPNGLIIEKYRKMHLFQLNPTQSSDTLSAHQPIDESHHFVPGNKIVAFNHDGFYIGLAICFDIRFSRLFNAMSELKPLDAIILPSAFARITGEKHWHLLLRSRAIEYQCYVIGSNQVGPRANGLTSYGHSIIIDPWGTPLADTGAKEGIAYANISLKKLSEYRQNLPLKQTTCSYHSLEPV